MTSALGLSANASRGGGNRSNKSTTADEISDWSQDNRKGSGARMLDQVEAYISTPDIEICILLLEAILVLYFHILLRDGPRD